MTAYEELLEFGGERIFDFLKNARLHESQFKYSEFNEVCYKKMYIENNQDSIKTVKELKEEIPELKDTCKGCGSYFMNPRNKSIKGLDVQFGRLLEDVIIDFLKTKYKLNVTHGDNSNKKYPDCMLLSGDKGILAYFEVKYHGAPFISAINKIGRYCYEGSATLDLNKLVKQIELRLMQPRQQDVFVMETKILQHWFILRYITKRASRDSVNTLLVDLMLMVVKEKKIQII